MLDRILPPVRRMPKCIISFPLETACLSFAVFSTIVSGSSLLALFILLSKINDRFRGGLFIDRWTRIPIDEPRNHDYVLVLNLLGVAALYFYTIVSFIFSVFLCYGLHKRRSSFVKLYLVYGVLLTIFMMMGAVLYSWVQRDLVGGSLVIVGCGVYSLLLLMVQRTHEIICSKAAHAPLLDSKKPCIQA